MLKSVSLVKIKKGVSKDFSFFVSFLPFFLLPLCPSPFTTKFESRALSLLGKCPTTELYPRLGWTLSFVVLTYDGCWSPWLVSISFLSLPLWSQCFLLLYACLFSPCFSHPRAFLLAILGGTHQGTSHYLPMARALTMWAKTAFSLKGKINV